eukprot:m.186891 g.186891  ORF g.186891 m.186891 type:complete len:106 (-) comp18147_c0_seq8:222-539(-)
MPRTLPAATELPYTWLRAAATQTACDFSSELGQTLPSKAEEVGQPHIVLPKREGQQTPFLGLLAVFVASSCVCKGSWISNFEFLVPDLRPRCPCPQAAGVALADG